MSERASVELWEGPLAAPSLVLGELLSERRVVSLAGAGPSMPLTFSEASFSFANDTALEASN
ncbi:MAG: hypothetical protein DLM70_09545 [Chloroflexi bacterium]|nr:MAG: hypothetical protein DLM70_09545 [Chloroflexota bacterium]